MICTSHTTNHVLKSKNIQKPKTKHMFLLPSFQLKLSQFSNLLEIRTPNLRLKLFIFSLHLANQAPPLNGSPTAPPLPLPRQFHGRHQRPGLRQPGRRLRHRQERRGHRLHGRRLERRDQRSGWNGFKTFSRHLKKLAPENTGSEKKYKKIEKKKQFA